MIDESVVRAMAEIIRQTMTTWAERDGSIQRERLAGAADHAARALLRSEGPLRVFWMPQGSAEDVTCGCDLPGSRADTTNGRCPRCRGLLP